MTTYLRGTCMCSCWYGNLTSPCCRVPLSLSWGGKTISIEVYWFQYESDPIRNSNVYQVASKAVSDHFPGEFGSERLVQQVVDHILRVTENKEGMEQVSGHHPANQPAPVQSPAPLQPSTQETLPGEANSDMHTCVMMDVSSERGTATSKIILTGAKSRTLHKEELTSSDAEKTVAKKIEENARIQQSKRKYSGPKSPVSKSPAPGTKTTPTSKSSAHGTKTTPTSKSPPKPQSVQPSKKRIRVTSSDGRTCNLNLDFTVTYALLQQAIEQELK